MILGHIAKSSHSRLGRDVLIEGFGLKLHDAQFFLDGPAAVALTKTDVPTLDGPDKCFQSKDGSFAVLQGNIYNHAQLAKEAVDGSSPLTGDAALLLHLCANDRSHLFADLNGAFAAAIWEAKAHRFVLLRDHFGIEPLFYYVDEHTVLFSTSLQALMRHRSLQRELDPAVLYRYLLFNYNPTADTFIKKIKKVPPGHFLVVRDGRVHHEKYWRLSFREQFDNRSEQHYREELQALFKEAIRLRLPHGPFRPGAFLSGGMDSSSIVGLMCPMLEGRALHTFSFRCEGKSFDESVYAKIMSQTYGTEHHQVEFPAKEVRRAGDLVTQMDEPFSDIGIELAAFLLGRSAGGAVDYVLTGDGGDELFAGHPVYVADKVANVFEKVPGFIRKTLTKTFQHLPDTDDKKSLAVKVKRFSYSFNFPASLHSNRWRIYYTGPEIHQLCQPDVLQAWNGEDPLLGIAGFYNDADGPDYLSRTLYGDYQTVVDFYLRRLQLIRTYGVEARLPMLDHRLVSYAARIPSHLKIRGYNQTKYILHKTMEGVLPNEIVFRKDKLGHSVPMKNWMRESQVVQDFVGSILSPQTLRRRGLFNAGFVQEMISQHLRRRHNHSHRLWALAVLELWLQKHIDRARDS